MLGPHLGKRLNTSHQFFLEYLNGAIRVIPNLYINISDVRDIAAAIIQSIESSRIIGRYISTNTAISHSAMLQVIHDNFTDLKLPVRKAPPLVLRAALRFDRSARAEYVRNNLGKFSLLFVILNIINIVVMLIY